MKNKFLITIVLLALFSSCMHKDEYVPTTITDNNIENVKDDALHNLFDSIEFISLQETPECLLGDIHKIQKVNNDYFVMASGSNRFPRIYRFNHEGIFLNSIGKIGNASSEYMRIGSFMVVNNWVYIADLNKKKMLIFDINGNFISSKDGNDNFPFLYDMEIIDSNKALFSYNINFKKSGTLFEIVDLKSFKELHTIKTNYVATGSISYSLKTIGKDCNKILLLFPAENTIYEIDEKSFALKKEISVELWGDVPQHESNDIEEVYNIIEESGTKLLCGVFVSGNKMLINSLSGSIVWNNTKKYGSYITNGNDLNKMQCFPFFPLSVIYADDKGFYSTMSADRFNSIMQETHPLETSLVPSPNFVSQMRNKTNPIIIKYKFKD